eukprot:COSAG05_NODE_21615_length_270_cov_1.204678_1_plen_20_part_10
MPAVKILPCSSYFVGLLEIS